MSINIYKDQMERAEVFGKPVLFTEQDIPRETIPDNWYCYDLCGNDRHPHKPTQLMDRVLWECLGTVLSPVPLKRAATEVRRIKDTLILTGEMTDLSGFCQERNLTCPSDPRKYVLHPASKEEAGLFYSHLEPDPDVEDSVVGHLRLYFDSGGRFRHSWWPHNNDHLNTPEFKETLQEFVDEMRVRGPLASDASMRRWCYRSSANEIGREQFGFIAETENYRFCLRCTTLDGDYGYIYCYDLNQQRLAMAEKNQALGLTETGLRHLQDTADPSFPHSYDWYVMEDCSTAYAKLTDGLSLDEAIRRYTACESDDKRLGITKDDVAAVDLVIRHDGREWVSEDWTKSESFKDDPVVAEAVEQIQHAMEEQTTVQGMTMGGMSL